MGHLQLMSAPEEFRVSVIVTVKNEAAAIGRLLDSISAQVRLPDEVVIADGGSRDQTVAAIEAWGARQAFPVHVLSVPGANISQGRNAAIRAAAGPIIASTDAGVRLDPLWLAKLLEPYAEQQAFLPERTLKLADASTSLATCCQRLLCTRPAECLRGRNERDGPTHD